MDGANLDELSARRSHEKAASAKASVTGCEFRRLGACKGPLDVAHVDGDEKNNARANLKKLCRAHHRLLDRGKINHKSPSMPDYYVDGSGKRRYEEESVLYVEGDPGLPLGVVDDPFAGLVEQDALDLTRAVLELDEGKAVGTADLGGDIARRDRQLKRQSISNVRYHVTQAARNARRDLSAVEDRARRDIETTLSGWLEGDVSFREVQDQTSFLWRQAYERVHEIGRHASGVHRLHLDAKVVAEEEKWFRSSLREEMRYWHLALDEWQKRRRAAARSGANAVAKVDDAGFRRFEAYLKSLDSMYDGARALALPPGVLAYWLGPDPSDDDGVCDGCAYMMERSPFPKAALPAVPRTGMTPCLTGCRHKLVLRAATAADIARRMSALPSRQSMLADLRRIKNMHHGTDRQQRAHANARRLRGAGRPHVVNPHHREPLGRMGQELPP